MIKVKPSYEEYFYRTYPFATHTLVDPPYNAYPISGTKVRIMSKVEALAWIWFNKSSIRRLLFILYLLYNKLDSIKYTIIRRK